MKSIKKSWILGGVAVLAATATVGFNAMKPMPVPVVEAVPKEVKLSFTEEGFVKDESTIDVYSLHPGAVLSLYVRENQRVEKGETLCKIDASQLQRDLEAARSSQKGYLSQISDLDLKEKQVKDELRVNRNKLQGDYETILADESTASQSYLSSEITKEEQVNLQNIIIEQNRTDLQNATDNLRKIETLYAVGAVPKQDADDSRAAVSQLESTLEQNIRQLEIIKNGSETQSRDAYFQSAKKSLLEQISGIDAQLSNTYSQAMKDYYSAQMESDGATIRLLEQQIEECTVKAPASGVITKLNMDKSNVAATDVPLAVISTGFESLIEIYVPTSEIGSVYLDDIVELELKSSIGTVYSGTVTEIDNKAVIQTSSLGVEKRKVKVTIQPLPEHIAYFKPGYDLTASFTTYHEENRLTVPRTAVTRIDDKPVIWVVVDGRLQRREIEIERELKVEYVVKTGLSAGEQVIKDASTPGLEDGRNVNGVIS